MRNLPTLPAHGRIFAAAMLLCFGGPAIATEAAVHNDMDGDGRSDLIWQHDVTGAVVYWSGAKSALMKRAEVTRPDNFDPQRWLVRGTGNYLDETPRVDLTLQDRYTGDFLGMYTDDPSTDYFVYPIELFASNLDWSLAGSGDFNGDGVSDLFWRNLRSGSNIVRFSGPWEFEFQYIASVTNFDWRVSSIGDFDGDGQSDILWRNSVTGANTIWRSANSQPRTSMTRVSNLDWQIVGVGDFNGDGRSDIFWRNATTGANVIWKSGSYATRQAVTGVSNREWKVASVGDFDGDGKADVFWRNSVTGANVIWLSASSATRQAVTRVSNLAWRVVP